MPAFQKAPQSDLHNYDPSRLYEHVPYSAHSQPPYVAQLLPSPLAGHGSQDLASSPYLTDQEYPGSVRFDEPRSPMFGFQLRQMLEVTGYFPQRGGEGTRLSVQIRSPCDLSQSRSTTFALSFGSHNCECVPQLASVQDSVFHYQFSVDTPTFISTQSAPFAVPLRLVIDHHADHTPTCLLVGVYTYEQVAQPSFSDDPHRVAPVNNAPPMHPHKRQPTQQIEIKGEHDHHPYHDDSPTSYSPFLPPGTTASGFPGLYASDNSPPALQFVGSSGISQPTLKAPSPLTPSWAGPMVAVNGVSMAAAPHPQAVSSARPLNPTLIRTSTISQSSNMGQALPFNPYAMYPTKAVLKLNGDLDSMTENWSPDERDAKRRLVQFTRVQSGSTIHADFKPVSPEDRAPNSICISCIHWEGKNECFVTSVDTIYLLESLVGVRFTVEEKNRIRRNLEGFRPLTVSKAKADSEEFFKVIMGFPAPKPRNIEKDVKVFPWKILGHALKKIIGKYSASYSSTAGALPGTINTGYSSNDPSSDAGTDSQHAPSPRSVSESTTPSTYAANLSTTAFSPPMGPSKPVLSNGVTGPSELGVTLADVNHPYGPVPTTYSYQPPCPAGQPILAARSSWGFNTLVNGNPTPNPANFNYVPAVPYSINPMTSGV